MNKTKISNLFLISILTFAISIFLGYLTYLIISGAPIFQRNAPTTPLPAGNTFSEIVVPTAVVATDEIDVISNTESFEEYYIVRENNGRIGVFAFQNGETHFLYNIDRLVRFLPETDQELLRQGVILRTREELTQFEEDFSS